MSTHLGCGGCGLVAYVEVQSVCMRRSVLPKEERGREKHPRGLLPKNGFGAKKVGMFVAAQGVSQPQSKGSQGRGWLHSRWRSSTEYGLRSTYSVSSHEACCTYGVGTGYRRFITTVLQSTSVFTQAWCPRLALSLNPRRPKTNGKKNRKQVGGWNSAEPPSRRPS